MKIGLYAIALFFMGTLGINADTTQTTTGTQSSTAISSDSSTRPRTESTLGSESNTSESTEETANNTTTNSSQTEESAVESSSIDETEGTISEPQESDDQIYYDTSLGLDPTYRSRSDIKVSLGRTARAAATVPYIEAGDPTTPSQDFIDISSHNGLISVDQFKIIKSYGVSAVVVKLTEATSYQNPLAASQIANAKAAGLIVHAYHYSWYTTESGARAEADYFVSYAKQLNLPTSMLMVNDYEEPNIKNKANHTALAQVFENRLKALGYTNTHHYIGISWITEKVIDPDVLGKNKVWIAQYPYEPVGQKHTEYSAWQWTYNVTFPGVSGTFDMNSDYNKYFISQGQGGAITDGRYATITKDNYTIWQNFSWTKKADSKAYLGQTLQVKVRYEHINGSTYYSLYDNQGKWIGYINAGGTKVATGAQGNWQSKNAYVKFKQQDTIYRDFSFNKTTKVTAAMLKNTYKVTGTYRHFNGTTYDSVYDLNGTWIGYIPTTKLTVQGNQGPAISDGRYVTIKSGNYSIWQNFSWKLKSSSKDYLNQTFLVKVRYEHLNGSVYYSLYDNKGTWYGYINATGTKTANNAGGAAISSSKYVTISSKNYSIWQNFSWKEKNKSSKLFGQTFQVKVYYNHFNGSVYYSLYDNKGTWYGYINANGTKTANNAGGAAISSSKYVTISSKNYSIWQNFSWKEKNKSSKLYGQTFQVRVYYNHFNGSTYYSLYDNKGTWYGYINANGTKAAK
ncbi:GH25 family lysozyme [Enterococcus sp. DIV0876]|uniref:GH25 family lysozyme n=1 Tax=Enterococcus sp. DIV0876 TaxID=2774633 RepID=UPI003D3008BA